MKAAYLETSAFVKFIIEEPETAALATFLQDWPEQLSSELLITESVRAVRRRGEAALPQLRDRLLAMELLPIDSTVLEMAGFIDPPVLRTLDAIHLATAQLLGLDLGVIVTYDERLAEGARALGLPVAAPA